MMARSRLSHMLYTASKVMLALAVAANGLAFIGKVAGTGSIWRGLMAVLGWFNPGNTEAFITEVLIFSPAVFAYLLAEYVAKSA